jgi:hypothetical protein
VRSNVQSRRDRQPVNDLKLRLDVLEKRGTYFPNPVTVLQASNGPANLGSKIQFQLYLNKGVDSVEILRGTARDAASAATLQTYAISDVTLNKPITYYDHDKAIVGKPAFYWVRVVPKHSKFRPFLMGPQIVNVPTNGDTYLTSLNAQVNTTNFATVDSVDSGTSATARIYGTGGVGSNWTRPTGYGQQQVYPSGSVVGLAYSTKYTILWTGTMYIAATTTAGTLPDQYVPVGLVTTVAAGGGGGTTGGGGSGGVGVRAGSRLVMLPD